MSRITHRHSGALVWAFVGRGLVDGEGRAVAVRSMPWLGIALGMVLAGDVRWTAPSSCPDEATVRARLDAAGGVGALDVDAVATPTEDGRWMLELGISLDGVRSVRTLDAGDCDALAEAAVLLIGLQLDAVDPGTAPQSAGSVPVPAVEPELELAPEPRFEREATAEPEPQAEPRVEQAPAEVRSPASPSRPPLALQGWVLGIGMGVSAGTVPLPGVPFELLVGWAWPRLRLGVRGRYHLARRVELGAGRDARVHAGMAGPEACARLGASGFEVPVCGQVSVGGTRSNTRGTARDRGGPWVETGADVGVVWALAPRVSLAGRLGVAVPLVGSRYVVDDVVAFDPGPVGGRVMFGLEFHRSIQNRGRPEKSP